MNPARLIVHGGAWSIPKDQEQAHINGMKSALQKVYPALKQGKISATQAVVEAIKIMEDDPTFDAGKGSFLNLKGEVEMDASIFDGTTFRAGSVACIQNVRNPIVVAQMVMEKSEHCMLVGKGALEFAKSVGIEEIDPIELLTDREIEFLKKIKNDEKFKSKTVFENKMGTVGCVALDVNGNICAGTSTGGTPKKLPGRTGDSGIIGSGSYADSLFGGASCTGWGESIMKVQMCGTAIRWLEFGVHKDAQSAADAIVDYLGKKVNGLGGIIIIDKKGNYGISYNTEKMAFAYVDNQDQIVARITK